MAKSKKKPAAARTTLGKLLPAKSTLGKLPKSGTSTTTTKALKGRGRTRRTPGVMNGLEQSYSEELERLRLAGAIHAWRFEPMTFKLADRCTYKPDFLVIMPDGLVEFHETKGFYEQHAKIKNKVVARDHPWFVFRLVQQKKKKDGGGFHITLLGPKLNEEEEHDNAQAA